MFGQVNSFGAYEVIGQMNEPEATEDGIFGAYEIVPGMSGMRGFGALNTSVLCGSLKEVQEALNALGYASGTPDGTMGPKTISALKAFAAKAGVAYSSSMPYPKGDLCAALIKALEAAKAPSKFAVFTPKTLAAVKTALTVPLKAPTASAQSAMPKASASATTTSSTSSGTGLVDKMKAWWAAQTPAMKYALGGAALLGVVGIGYFAMGGGSSASEYTANKRRARRRRTRKSGSCKPRRGVKTCRCKPPKGYPKKRSAYAFGECFMYPLNTKQRVRTAAARFGKHKRRYPKSVQRQIATKIDRAKRRFGIGEHRRSSSSRSGPERGKYAVWSKDGKHGSYRTQATAEAAAKRVSKGRGYVWVVEKAPNGLLRRASYDSGKLIKRTQRSTGGGPRWTDPKTGKTHWGFWNDPRSY